MDSIDAAERRAAARIAGGRKGGRTTRQRYGVEFFATIGRAGGPLGGQTTLARYGTEHFRRMAKIAGDRRSELARLRNLAMGQGSGDAAGGTRLSGVTE